MIVNFETFQHNEDKTRKGSQHDVIKLGKLFHELGFTTVVKKDLTCLQFLNQLSLFSDDESHKKAETCVIVIMSHGVY